MSVAVIAAGRVHRAQAADKLHTHALFHFFNFAQQDAADLSGGANVCAAARSQIKIGDIDQPKVAGLFRWKLAQPELPGFFQRNKANTDRTVFSDDFIRQQLRFLRLREDRPGVSKSMVQLSSPMWKLTVGILNSLINAAESTCCPECCCTWSRRRAASTLPWTGVPQPAPPMQNGERVQFHRRQLQ